MAGSSWTSSTRISSSTAPAGGPPGPQAGLPVKLVFPSITPNIMEGGGLLVGAKRSQNGKLWLDFVASPEGAAIYKPFVGAATTPGFSNIDLSGVKLWKMKKPVDANEFKRTWAAKYEQK